MVDSLDGNVLATKSLACVGVMGIPVTSLANRAVQMGIRFIAFHNEQSVGYVAFADDYLTGRLSLLLTVSGPGCVHGLVGLSNAMINTWPMVMISGSFDQKDSNRGDFQELDQIEVVKPFSKFSIKAKDIKKILSCVARVLDLVVSSPPNRCYLNLPTDVLHQTITESEAKNLLVEAEKGRTFEETIASESSEIEKAVSLLRKVKRPSIVFGKRATYGKVKGGMRKLAKRTRIPFLPTPMGKRLVNDDHELATSVANWCTTMLYSADGSRYDHEF